MAPEPNNGDDGYSILLRGMRVPARVGVLPEERNQPQTLEIDVRIDCPADPATLDDDIARTVDYAEINQAIRRLAIDSHRDLIETLADDLCLLVTATHPGIRSVTVEARKFILPDTDHVAVRRTHRLNGPGA